jgi:hypothetical protein
MIKGSYMVYAYPQKIDQKGTTDILSCIASNISLSSEPPVLLSKMNALRWDTDKSIYFTGNLGLSSVYNFHYKDVFDYEEGAAVVGEDFICVLLEYKNADKCNEMFARSFDFFKERKKYENPQLKDSSYQLIDRKERQLDFHKHNNYLIIFIHKGEQDMEERFSELNILLDA